jgi:DivIVA domain-containing protein
VSLTPLDIDKASFRRGFFGYSQQEVHEFLHDASQTLEGCLTQIAQQQARLAELEAELSRYRTDEQTQRTQAALAQRTADELVAAARERAVGIRREAELEADALKSSLAALRAEREQFEQSFRGLLAGFTGMLEAASPGLKQPEAAPAMAWPEAVEPVRPAVAAAEPAPPSAPLPETAPASEPAGPSTTVPTPARAVPPPPAPRIQLQPGVTPRPATAAEPSRAELIDLLSGGAAGLHSAPDADAAELERILAAAQPAARSEPATPGGPGLPYS